MAEQQFRFDDGAAYEYFMGVWSRLVGEIFLDWVKPPSGKDWIDVGCGNGAFTELVVSRCSPASIVGIDPSEGQLKFARTRPSGGVATYRQADAMALPLADDSVDVAVSALVIFFMPDPAKGVTEMARVTRSGGTVATYAWDLLGGGFPYEPVHAELTAVGMPAMSPPHPEAARPEELKRLWTAAGLKDVEVRTIEVSRPFASVDDFWLAAMTPGIRPVVEAMPAPVAAGIKERVAARLSRDGSGAVAPTARAHAVKGRVG